MYYGKTLLLASALVMGMCVSAEDAGAFLTGQPGPGKGAYTRQDSHTNSSPSRPGECFGCHWGYMWGGGGQTGTPLGGDPGGNGFGGRPLH